MFLLLNKYLTTYTNSPSLPASLPLSVSTSVDNMLPTRISLLQVPPTAAGRQSAGSNNVLMCATFRLTHWLTHWLTHSRSCQPVAGSDWLTDNWTDQETESDTGTVCVGKGQTAAAAAAKLVFWQMFYNELSLLYKLVVICSWLTDWQTDWLIDWLMAALIAWHVNTIHTHTHRSSASFTTKTLVNSYQSQSCRVFINQIIFAFYNMQRQKWKWNLITSC